MTSTQHTDIGLTDANAGCSCGHAVTPAPMEPSDATSTEYLVSGMTCSHCVSSVTEELNRLDGVSGVRIDLVAGGDSVVSIASASPLDPQLVRGAVEEAGYHLVDRS